MKKTIIALKLASPVLSARARYEGSYVPSATVRVKVHQIKEVQ